MVYTNVNHDLLRMLRQMDVLSSGAAPSVKGPFRIQADAFTGDTSGNTQALTQTPKSGGIFSAITIATAAGTANTLTALTEDTDFSVSGSTLTFLTDQSANQVFLLYAY